MQPLFKNTALLFETLFGRHSSRICVKKEGFMKGRNNEKNDIHKTKNDLHKQMTYTEPVSPLAGTWGW